MALKTAHKVIDWDLSVKLAAGKKALAKELLGQFISDLPLFKQQIRAKVKLDDYEALGDIVHKLHGACCYCGVPLLKVRVATLENALKTKTAANIRSLVSEICGAIDNVITSAREPLESPVT